MKRAVVSQRVDGFADRQETRNGLDVRLVELLLAVDCLPYPVPSRLGDHLPAWLAAIQPDLVVLSGGNDLGRCPERDMLERMLLACAADQTLPVLGICRGMQMMADFAGMGLRAVAGHVRTRHDLSGQICRTVNSYHAFVLDACPADYEVLARGPDHEIEAIGHRSLPWEGWMWHPEREAEFDPADLERLQMLIGV